MVVTGDLMIRIEIARDTRHKSESVEFKNAVCAILLRVNIQITVHTTPASYTADKAHMLGTACCDRSSCACV